mmetsp:Transcript_2714/g.9104  ORF Transcript_2714/g.9104 Transcript_2714/m.9104 type:complete len:280 (+) Transcript_2714:3264-4103(+)
MRSVCHRVAAAALRGRGVAQMVVTREGRRLTPRRPRVPPAGLDPQSVVVGRLALANVVGPTLVGVLIQGLDALAISDGMVLFVATLPVVAYVLRMRLVKSAARQVVGEHGNVSPRRGVPVRVIIALLRTFKAPAVAVRILPGVDGTIAGTAEILVGRVQPTIALANTAVLVPRQRLVQAILRIRLALRSGRHAAGRLPVSQAWCRVLAHILKHDITLHVALTTAAAMLDGPVDMQERPLVVVHLALARARRVRVVLAIGVGTHRVAVVSDLISTSRIVL